MRRQDSELFSCTNSSEEKRNANRWRSLAERQPESSSKDAVRERARGYEQGEQLVHRKVAVGTPVIPAHSFITQSCQGIELGGAMCRQETRQCSYGAQQHNGHYQRQGIAGLQTVKQ